MKCIAEKTFDVRLMKEIQRAEIEISTPSQSNLLLSKTMFLWTIRPVGQAGCEALDNSTYAVTGSKRGMIMTKENGNIILSLDIIGD
jgi:hypothetical protein